MAIGTIFYQLLILLAYALLGFLCGRTRYMPEPTADVLSKLVVRIAMPALILSKLLGAEFTRENYRDSFTLMGIAVVSLALVFLGTLPLRRLLRLDAQQRGVYSMQALFGNVIFFAYPLFQALFGDIGVIYALFFNLGNDALLWTLGVYLAGSHRKQSFRSSALHLINANTIAFVLGFLMLVFRVPARLEASAAAVRTGYHILSDVLGAVGAVASPLSMVFVGFVLAEKGVMRVRSRGEMLAVACLSVQKLLLVPLAAMLILYVLRNCGVISDLVWMIGVLQLAMPVGTVTASLCAEYGSDRVLATKNIFVTTFLALLTLPLLCLLLRALS